MGKSVKIGSALRKAATEYSEYASVGSGLSDNPKMMLVGGSCEPAQIRYSAYASA